MFIRISRSSGIGMLSVIDLASPSSPLALMGTQGLFFERLLAIVVLPQYVRYRTGDSAVAKAWLLKLKSAAAWFGLSNSKATF